jgi:hypothetical protein
MSALERAPIKGLHRPLVPFTGAALSARVGASQWLAASIFVTSPRTFAAALRRV